VQQNGNLAVLQMEDSPIQCIYEMSREARDLPPSLVGTERLPTDLLPALKYKCQCGPGYTTDSRSDGVCEPIPPFWNTARIIALTVGSVFVVMLILVAVFRKKHVRRKRKYNMSLEMHQGLLEQSQGEVLELKRAWEIDPSELSLECRIDIGSEGAFGEVWRGNWTGLEVAVKLVRSHFLELGSDVSGEFEREIDFMQRTRHVNIVRFFGAGTLVDGTPFLVEELMSEGSLKLFVRNNRCHDTQLKYSFARDVACGMAHIHSLGHMHRDLKSGNVLITQRLQAKVADFGSVGRMLRGQATRISRQSHSGRPETMSLTVDLAGDLTVGVSAHSQMIAAPCCYFGVFRC